MGSFDRVERVSVHFFVAVVEVSSEKREAINQLQEILVPKPDTPPRGLLQYCRHLWYRTTLKNDTSHVWAESCTPSAINRFQKVWKET